MMRVPHTAGRNGNGVIIRSICFAIGGRDERDVGVRLLDALIEDRKRV